jgi:hypothetical protein
MMQIKKEPFELVVHIDEVGTRATASYRTRVFDDAGDVIDGATKTEGVTLTELGATFPWSEFINSATQALLVQCEAQTKAVADAQAALATITAERDELKAQVAPPPLAPDHQTIADAVYQNVMATINANPLTPDAVAEQTWLQRILSSITGK